MELTLTVTSGKHAGHQLRVPAPKFLIGRGEDCQLRPSGDLVSRHHCVLLVGTGGAVVRDLNSRNGTFVNDERILGERSLQSGDRLSIGQFQFEVCLRAPAVSERPKTPEVKQTASPEVDHADDSDVMEWFKQEPPSALRDTVRIDAPEAAANASLQKETLVDLPAVTDDGQPPAKPSPIPLARPVAQDSAFKDSQDAAAKALKQFLKGR